MSFASNPPVSAGLLRSLGYVERKRLAANKCFYPGYVEVTGSTGFNAWSRHRTPDETDIEDIEVVYGNLRCMLPEGDGQSGLTLQCVLEYPLGDPMGVVADGPSAAGPLALTLAPGQIGSFVFERGLPKATEFGIHTFGLGTSWSEGFATVGALGAMQRGTTTNRSKTAGGLGQNTSGFTGPLYTPLAILGRHATRQVPAVAVHGDSVSVGMYDGNSQYMGFVAIALGSRVPWTHLGQPSLGLRHYGLIPGIGTGSWFRRSMASRGATSAIVQLGRNDFSYATLDQIKQGYLAFWSLLAGQRLKVFETTKTPACTSSDNWTTQGGIAAHSTEPDVSAYNDWLRDGAPITSGAPAAIGTAANLCSRRGEPTHPLHELFEVSDLVSTARNSGVWRLPYIKTGESLGLHPNRAGSELMATAVDWRKLV